MREERAIRSQCSSCSLEKQFSVGLGQDYSDPLYYKAIPLNIFFAKNDKNNGKR